MMVKVKWFEVNYDPSATIEERLYGEAVSSSTHYEGTMIWAEGANILVACNDSRIRKVRYSDVTVVRQD